MRRRFPGFKLGQEVGAAGTAPSWARRPVGMAPSWAGHPCPMLGAACGAVADGRTRSRCPWAQSWPWDHARLPLAHPGTAPGHGGVSPLPISPPSSTTRFQASFRGLICTGMWLLQRPTGTPVCREDAGATTPVSPNTSVQINLLPPTPSLGFWALSVCRRLPGGRGVVGRGGLIPVPTGFVLLRVTSTHPTYLGLGNRVGGRRGEGLVSVLGSNFRCWFWAAWSL